MHNPSNQRTGWALSLMMLLFLATPHLGTAQEAPLTLHPKSQFQIQGQATTHSFTCVVNEVHGRARLPSRGGAVSASTGEEKAEVIVSVPVESFDCGNSRMTADLQEALRAEEHPTIRFELVHATVDSPTDTSSAWRLVHALGPLQISGTKRLVRVEAVGQALDAEHFRVQGCKPIRMTYFGIEPPTKALGLIRVKNRVEVQFDLLAHRESVADSPFTNVTPEPPSTCSE